MSHIGEGEGGNGGEIAFTSGLEMLRTRAEAVLSELPQDPPASLDWPPLPGCIPEEETEVDDSISNQDARDSRRLETVCPPASLQAAVSCNKDCHLDVNEPEGSVAATPVREATAADAAPAAARHDVAAGGSDADKGAGL